MLPQAEAVAVGSISVDRLAGADRFVTAIAIAQAAYPATAPVVYLANGYDFPDALAAAPASVAAGGPLLLTAQDALRDDVVAEIERLAPAKVIIVGGDAAVSEAITVDLAARGFVVERQAGADRYETARRVVGGAFTSASTAILATGRDYPDALAASAAAGSKRIPVLLVDGSASSLDAANRDLLTALGVTAAHLVGGTAVMSAGIATSLSGMGISTARHSGDDRFGTSLAIDKAFFPTATRAFLASGADFPDALAGSALAGAAGAPLYSVSPACVDASIRYDVVSRLGVSRVTLLGGEGVLGRGVASLTECAGLSISERELVSKLSTQAASLPGEYSISIREFGGQARQVSIDGAARKEPASVIKLFAAYVILFRVDQGRLSLDTVTRSGISVRNCLRVMIQISDNLCHADLLALVGNTEINRQLYLSGFRNTFYVGYDGTGRWQSAKKSSTDDLALLIEKLERGILLTPQSSALLTSLMTDQLWRSKIPSGVPSATTFGNKTGQLWITSGLVEGDAGVVRAPSGTYSIAVLGDRNAANWAIARLSRTAYEHLAGAAITPARWGSTNLITTSTATIYSDAGRTRIGTIPAGTRLVADSSSRVYYRVGYNGKWVWLHHSTVATKY